VDALPVLGAGAVLIPWGLLSFLRGSTGDGVGLLLIYAVIAIARTTLEPRFLGKQMGLHPLLTLLSLYGGFRLFGVSGMILVPVGVMLCKQLYELSREF
jgi:predicted PurR-regulated permease PerM